MNHFPLHEAIIEMNIEKVGSLLKQGETINKKDNKGCVPLCAVFWNQNPNVLHKCFIMIKYLVENGADVNAKDNNDNNLIYYMCMSGCNNNEVYCYLIRNGVDPNNQNVHGWTVLHKTCSIPHLFNIVLFLIENGASLEIKDNFGRFPADYLQPDKKADLLKMCKSKTPIMCTVIKKHLTTEENGVYYGYPLCCIKNFQDNLLQPGRERNEIYKLNINVSKNTGFIPCNEHTQQILDNKIVLEDLIVMRKCGFPFPNNKETSI